MLTLESLRRQIAVRNWLPGEGRAGAGAVIQAARPKGIECAPMAAAKRLSQAGIQARSPLPSGAMP
ncbi:MAG TPA: hypothetical protein VFG05_08490 [Methylocella sp.]|nr:hypothetical protein [Methylocella sp.]